MICKRRTIAGSIGTTLAFLGGGLIMIQVAEIIATVLCWVIIVGVVIAIIAAALSG
jgi:hypothetical protein